jgi:Rieske Fe-S protein
MTPESTRDSETSSGGAGPDPCPTRRGVLLGVGLAGLTGVLAGCSTAAVAYDANEAGVPPNRPAQDAMPSTPGPAGPVPASPGPASPGPASPLPASPVPASSAPASPAPASPAPASSEPAMKSEPAKQKAKPKLAGTVLGAASDIPFGGGAIYTAAKVVVTQPASGQYKAFSAVCTHVGCLVNKVADGTIDCPCHGSEFRITTGAVVTGPARSPLPAKQIKIVDGQVVLL